MSSTFQDIILIKSSYREYLYGVGTYLNNLILGISQLPQVNLYILDLSRYSDIFQINKEGMVTYINSPLILDSTSFNRSPSTLKEAALLVTNILEENLNIQNSLLISNCCNEFYISQELKQRFNGTNMFVLHTATLQLDIPKNKTLNSFLQSYDKLIFPSSYCSSFFNRNMKLKINKSKIIHNGLYCNDINCLTPLTQDEIAKINKEYCIKDNERIILYVGRVDYQKGIHYLLKAFRILLHNEDKFKLILVGNGDIGDFLPLCKGFFSKIIFTGYLNHDEVIRLYKIAAVGVIPSINENCSYTALEMMFYGLSVIASNVGGLPELINHGETGYLVDYTNIDKIPLLLSDSIISIDINKQEIIRKARENVLNKFNAVKMAQEYLNIVIDEK